MVNRLLRFVEQIFRFLYKILGEAQSCNESIMEGKQTQTDFAIDTRDQLEVREKQEKLHPTIIADLSIVQVVPSIRSDNQAFQVVERLHNRLPQNLPTDVAKLAAHNAAFLQGILAMQELNLDEDLFLEAVEELKRRY